MGQGGAITWLVGAAMATLCLDQGSKRLLEGRSPALATGPAPRVGVVSLRRQWNTAWLAGRHRPAALIFLWLVAAGSAVAMVAVGSQFHHRPALLGLGAALGGSAGNLLDHRRHGAVVDFIKVGRWPTFNLADIGIVAGVVITLWAMGS